MIVYQFHELVSSLGSGIVMSGENCFDLLFQEDNVASTTYLTRDGYRVATDIIIQDMSGMHAIRRKALMHHILLVNDLMARNGNYRLCIDFRKFLVLTGEFNIHECSCDVFPEILMFWIDQVKAMREVVDAFMYPQ